MYILGEPKNLRLDLTTLRLPSLTLDFLGFSTCLCLLLSRYFVNEMRYRDIFFANGLGPFANRSLLKIGRIG